MKNLTMITGPGGALSADLTGARLRARGDYAPGATAGIACIGIHPLGFAAIR